MRLDNACVSLITIKHASDTDSTYTIVGTDIYGNAQTEAIAVTTTDITSGLKVFQTVTSITPSGNGPSNVIIGVASTVTNKSALVTITSGASDESDKTFTVVGTDMDGAALSETITTDSTTNSTVIQKHI